MARERPDCPILGLTSSEASARRLAVVWGVHPVVTQEATSMTDMVTRALRAAQTEGFAKSGDEVVVTAGVPFGVPGTTNALRVARREVARRYKSSTAMIRRRYNQPVAR